jgi:hypothetical protein
MLLARDAQARWYSGFGRRPRWEAPPSGFRRGFSRDPMSIVARLVRMRAP